MDREQISSIAGFPNGDGRLLCIDDDIIILEILKAILESSGYSVIVASSGSQGLRVLADYAIDLVILDWEMPQMNGRETALEIKRVKPEMPIIINSGSPIPEDTFEIADAFVPKGIERQFLLRAISELISRASHEGPTPREKKEAKQEYFS
jgi:DNA-binding response OmpR family regulator